MRLIKIMFTCLVMGSLIAGCSAEVKSKKGSGNDSGKGKASQKVFSGMEGHWISGCIESEWGPGSSRMIELRIEGNSLEYDKVYFADTSCTQVRDGQEERYVGEMLNQGKLANGKIDVQFKIPIDGNVWTWKNFVIKKEAGLLLISDFYGSSSPSDAVVDIELARLDGEDEEDSEEGSDLALQSGYYRASGGDNWSCDQVLSTATSGGLTMQVWLQSTCGEPTIQMNCNGDTCEGQFHYITVTSGSTFKLHEPEGFVTEFELR